MARKEQLSAVARSKCFRVGPKQLGLNQPKDQPVMEKAARLTGRGGGGGLVRIFPFLIKIHLKSSSQN